MVLIDCVAAADSDVMTETSVNNRPQNEEENLETEEIQFQSSVTIPSSLEKHLDVLRINEEGGILIGCSALTGRYWKGSLWYYENLSDAPEPSLCTAVLPYNSGISDTQWITSSLVITASDSGSVGVYNIRKEGRSFESEWELIEHDDRVTGVGVCANSTNAISVGADCNVKIWDIPAQQSINRYRGHYDSISSVSCHAKEADVFLTASKDGHVILWDRRKMRPALRLDTSPLEYEPTCVTWLPMSDNNYAVSDISGCLLVKDLRSADQSIHYSQPHQRSLSAIAFNPSNPSLVATTSDDCTVVVTDITSGDQVYKNSSHTDYVKGCVWSNNQENIVTTCSWDSTIKMHYINSGQNNGESQTMDDEPSSTS
ncbi:methylosome protein WDR77-like [Tubulanus polymorphus]|uniref:methylosome protein WDR77-like n=1 Tax=Tubulanus polymorphus TaxID=672921 RepID=UPI003DA26D77